MTATRVLQLEPAAVPEWEAEDLMTARLATELEPAGPGQAEQMLGRMRLELPDTLDHRELVSYSAARGTPLEETFVPDLTKFDFHLVEIPLNILIPDGGDGGQRRLVRLRVAAGIEAGEGAVAVAYDLFPRDQSTVVEHHPGDLTIDVAKALTFVAPVVGDALGLKLNIPIRWHTETVQIRTSDRMSNPVEWYVTDAAINQGFTSYLIARVPKGAPVSLRTQVWCELRRPGLIGKVTKATYRSGEVLYPLAPSP